MIHVYIEVCIFCNKGCFNLNVKFRDILLMLRIGNTQNPCYGWFIMMVFMLIFIFFFNIIYLLFSFIWILVCRWQTIKKNFRTSQATAGGAAGGTWSEGKEVWYLATLTTPGFDPVNTIDLIDDTWKIFKASF